MKTRIISVFLLLALLLSYGSLNIFAQEAEGTHGDHAMVDVNQDNVCDTCTGGVGIAPEKWQYTAAELAEAAESLGITPIHITGFSGPVSDAELEVGTVYNFAGSDLRFINRDYTHVEVAEEGGNYYIKYGKALNADGSAATVKNNAEYLQYDTVASTSTANSAAYFADLHGKAYTVSIDFIHYGNYNELKPFTIYSFTNYAASTSISFIPIQIAKSGTISFYDGNTGAYESTEYTIPQNSDWVTLSLHHEPETNSYSIFVDGVCIARDKRAIKESSCIDFDGTYSGYALKGNSSTDFMVGRIRTPQLTAASSDIYAFDEFKLYYGDFVECDHDYVMYHEHKATDNVTYTCEKCGKSDTVTVGESAVASGPVAAGEAFAVLAAGSSADVRLNAPLNDDIKTPTESRPANYAGSGFTVVNNADIDFITVGEENANYFIKFKSPTATGTEDKPSGSTFTGTDYLYFDPFGAYVNKSIPAGFANYRGTSYTITFDFYWNNNHYNSSSGTGTDTSLLEIRSPLKDSNFAYFGATLQIKGTSLKWSTATNSDGVIYSDLPVETWLQISFTHVPAENKYYLYIDGEQVAQGDLFDTVYDTFENATYGTIDPVHDFTVSRIMLLNSKFYNANIQGDICAFDNFKVYTGHNLECKHSFADGSAACEWCGATVDLQSSTYCSICDGEAISLHSAVTDRSVSLGELIDMNVWMKISDELAKKDGAKVVLTCDDRVAEYELAGLVADENGKYKFSIPLRSTQMASDIVVTVVGEDMQNEYVTSIVDYADALLAESDDESAKSLVKAMLNYGAAAQVYFSDKNGNGDLTASGEDLANKNLDSADKQVAELPAEMLVEYAFSQKDATSSVCFSGASLLMSSKTHMKLFFLASENATVTVDGITVTPTYDETYGEYYIIVSAATPKNALTDRHTVVITDGGTSVSATVCIANAVVAGYANEAIADDFKALLGAYGWYCMYTAEYADAATN